MLDINQLADLAARGRPFKSVDAKIIKTFENKENMLLLANEEIINVFVNILENSLKYSKSNPIIEIVVKNEKSNTVILFKDNGIGMNKKVKSKIFEKFYRERGNIHNIKGHGLGLAFVKKIVDMHSGMISVNSKEGVGSTFTITFTNVN